MPRPRDKCLGADFISRLMWQVFIAMHWTADTAVGRGVARDPEDASAFGKAGAPLVWQTWKQDWELLPGDGISTPWTEYEVMPPPCDFIEKKPGKKRVRVTMENWAELFEASGGTLLDKINLVRDAPEHELSFVFTGPVITSDRQYVRYETRFNQAFYECVRDGAGEGCHSPESPTDADPLSLPAFTDRADGAIAVKAAWRPLANEGEKATHHWSEVLVPYYEKDRKGDLVSVCRPETHVLVGMHVIYKNGYVYKKQGKDRGATGGEKQADAPTNQWIWATFEHQAFGRSCTDERAAWKNEGYSYEPPVLERGPLPPPEKRTPVELCRLTDVPVTTAEVNGTYQGFLPAPWKHYHLVASQWLMGGNRRPSRDVANVILEAYAQGDTCMGCHDQESTKADFIWTLVLDEEHDPPVDESANITNPEHVWR